MKKLLNRLLFGKIPFKEFPAIGIEGNTIEETVFLETDGKLLDVSNAHFILSLEPMVFGIWFNKNPNDNEAATYKLIFHSKEGKVLAITDLKFNESIINKKGVLLLYETIKTEVYHVGWMKVKLIYWFYYKKPNVSFNQFKNLATAFSYPRKVWLVSFKSEDHLNFFPMDLVGEIPGTNHFVLGLRHSNITLDKIIEQKKIVVSEFPSDSKEQIYQLANHHSSSPPNIEALAFAIRETNFYKFPVAEWIIKYHEIEIIETRNLGSHILMWGSSVNSAEENEGISNLYHTHFLNYLS